MLGLYLHATTIQARQLNQLLLVDEGLDVDAVDVLVNGGSLGDFAQLSDQLLLPLKGVALVRVGTLRALMVELLVLSISKDSAISRGNADQRKRRERQ